MEDNDRSILEDLQDIIRLGEENKALAAGKDPMTYSANIFGMPEEESQDNPELIYLNWLEFQDPESSSPWNRERIENLRALVLADIEAKRQHKLINKLTEPPHEAH